MLATYHMVNIFHFHFHFSTFLWSMTSWLKKAFLCPGGAGSFLKKLRDIILQPNCPNCQLCYSWSVPCVPQKFNIACKCIFVKSIWIHARACTCQLIRSSLFEITFTSFRYFILKVFWMYSWKIFGRKICQRRILKCYSVSSSGGESMIFWVAECCGVL